MPAERTAPASSASSAVSARAVAAPAPTETVERPDRGLARGVWEAPPAFFYLVGGAACMLAIGYVLARRGLFRRLKARIFPGFKGLS